MVLVIEFDKQAGKDCKSTKTLCFQLETFDWNSNLDTHLKSAQFSDLKLLTFLVFGKLWPMWALNDQILLRWMLMVESRLGQPN